MIRIYGGKKSGRPGLPPGSLVHIGEKKTEKVKIRLMDYDQSSLEEKELDSIDEVRPYRDSPTVSWIDITGLHQIDLVEDIGKIFELHPLVLEDILNTGQRPKIEYFEDYLFVVLKMIYIRDSSPEIVAEQVSLILGPQFVLSFQETEVDIFDPVRERIRNGRGRLRKAGADYLSYALLDAVVDNYFSVLEHVGGRIESMEEKLVGSPEPAVLQEIHALKRDLIYMRKSMWPLREVIGSLEKEETTLVGESVGIFLRDVYDHTIQIIDSVETFRDMVSGMLDIYLSSVSNRMNEVMKVLTIIATIFIPLTFIAGIYGMNFENMPELKMSFGYPAVWIVMAGVAVSMFIYFRRKGWM